MVYRDSTSYSSRLTKASKLNSKKTLAMSCFEMKFYG